VPAAEPGRAARRRAPALADDDLRVRRALADAERLGRGARRVDRRADLLGASELGQTCASATPNAGGSATSGR
jgi:hypothetical protein